MKRWEVVKGVQEGLYPIGTRFKVEYPNDTEYAVINKHGCLSWDNETLVHIASYNKDEWTVINI